jgi:parvulin-like peptidyl-prolyl isomerase
MTQSAKVTVTIAVVVALACGALWAQISSITVTPVVVSSEQLEKYAIEYLPPAELQNLASNPEERKKWIEEFRKILAVGQVAEQEGYLTRPKYRASIELDIENELARAYAKRHPEPVTREEIAAFHKENPGSFDKFVQDVGDARFQTASQAQKESIKNAFGEIKVKARKARQDRLDQDPAIQLRLLRAKYETLAALYSEDLRASIEKSVTDQAIGEYYKNHAPGGEFDEVRARHILISPTDRHGRDDGHGHDEETPAKPVSREEASAKAESILQRVRGGADFAELARENSDDPGSKTKGGDLGYFARGQNVAAFDATAFSLAAGQVSGIVETEFGFHIIKVEDRRTPALDAKMQQTITNKLRKEQLEAAIDRIAARGRVRIPGDFTISPGAAVESAPAQAGRN